MSEIKLRAKRKRAKARVLDRCASEQSELATLREQVKVLRAALGSYAECCDGCTCGDGWSHDIAIEALEQTKPKEGE